MVRNGVLLMVAMAVLLSGCGGPDLVGESVSLAGGQVPPDGNSSRTITCGSVAVLEVVMPATGEGTITATVRDGNNVPIEATTYRIGDGTVETDLSGAGGLWTLRVDRSMEMGPDYRVTLTC